MIHVDINIYCDALTLLLGEKVDIQKEVKNQFIQTDYYSDQIIYDLEDKYEDFYLLFEKSSLDFVDYITAVEKDTVFDYGESRACEDLRTVSFLVPCDFDDKKYIEDLLKENDKNVQELD